MGGSSSNRNPGHATANAGRLEKTEGKAKFFFLIREARGRLKKPRDKASIEYTAMECNLDCEAGVSEAMIRHWINSFGEDAKHFSDYCKKVQGK